MGIVHNLKFGRGYINQTKWPKVISHRRALRALTRQNRQFLKSLGLRLRR